MEDWQIIDLYFKRDEAAISETDKKYGGFCRGVAINILSSDEDAKECVNDTWFQAWNAIPPQRPDKLGAWLGRVVRNIAINLWNKNRRKKRYAGMEQLLKELEDCIPSSKTVEHEIEEKELTEVLNTWLASLSKNDRILFMRRYWNGEMLNNLAKEYGATPGKLAKRMYKLRQNLKSMLEKEGYSL
ncbi:MAG: sigma-70 family RNA polymerase sigma factor [Lachnospiraceae bacterium]|nr:sigma-70 family RNA polymerase sigma factor [Lachnospiraceae bacterium]